MKWFLLLVVFTGVAYADTPQSGEVDDQAKARKLLLLDKACMVKGDAESCWEAGQETDGEVKSRKYYDQACNKRHVRSCFELAKILESDDNNKSRKAAVVIYKKLISMFEPRCDAKDAEDPYACNKLADLYEKMASAYRNLACQIDPEHCNQ